MTRYPQRTGLLRVLDVREGGWRSLPVRAAHPQKTLQVIEIETQGAMQDEAKSNLAEQVAKAAISFQFARTGHAPRAATVVLSGDTLVITLHEALSEAERVMARSPEGAARVQNFHRQLFSVSAESLQQEIQRITGVAVRESAAEVEINSGAVVHAFTSGTMVQVFQLAQPITAAIWNAPADDGRAA